MNLACVRGGLCVRADDSPIAGGGGVVVARLFDAAADGAAPLLLFFASSAAPRDRLLRLTHRPFCIRCPSSSRASKTNHTTTRLPLLKTKHRARPAPPFFLFPCRSALQLHNFERVERTKTRPASGGYA